MYIAVQYQKSRNRCFWGARKPHRSLEKVLPAYIHERLSKRDHLTPKEEKNIQNLVYDVPQLSAASNQAGLSAFLHRSPSARQAWMPERGSRPQVDCAPRSQGNKKTLCDTKNSHVRSHSHAVEARTSSSSQKAHDRAEHALRPELHQKRHHTI